MSFCKECYHAVCPFSWCHAMCPFAKGVIMLFSFFHGVVMPCVLLPRVVSCRLVHPAADKVSRGFIVAQNESAAQLLSPQPDTRAPISSQVQLGACACLARDGVPSPGSKSRLKLPPRGTRWPTLRPGPGQDSCGGLLPCLHKHTELGGRCSIPGCANTP